MIESWKWCAYCSDHLLASIVSPLVTDRLLSCICPEIFSDYADLESFLPKDNTEAKGDEEKSKKVVEALHKILRPFLLQRVKSDVKNSLLPSTFSWQPLSFLGSVVLMN